MLRFSATPAAAALIIAALTTMAAAAYQGISFDVEFEAPGAPANTKTVRVYLVFSNPDDELLAVSSPIEITTDAPGGFLNDCASPLACFPEGDLPSVLSAPWDTRVTIGDPDAPSNQTQLAPRFGGGNGSEAVLCVNAICDDDSGWFNANPGVPVRPGRFGRIPIGVFTFRDGPGCAGTGLYMRGVAAWKPAGGTLVQSPFELLWDACPFPDIACATTFPCACADCAQDVDQSGSVDFNDLLSLLAAWGPCTFCAEDIDDSGSVDFDDLLAVLSAWGPC